MLVDEQEPYDKSGETVGIAVDHADVVLDEQPGGQPPWRPE